MVGAAPEKEAAMVVHRRIAERVAVDAIEITWQPLHDHGALAGPVGARRAEIS